MANQALVWGTVDSEVVARQVGDQNKKVAEFRVNDGSTWITIVAWEALAEKAVLLEKGDFVIVGGRIRTRSYEHKEKGKTYVTEVIASSIDSIGALPADDDVIPD